MFGRTLRTALLVMAVGTASMTSLALPTVRAVVAALPPSHSGGSVSASGLRGVFSQSHTEFGDIAAEVACSYLRKFGTAQGTFHPVQAGTKPERMNTRALEEAAETIALATER